MEIIELHGKEEILSSFELIKEMYPSMTLDQYSKDIDAMLLNHYFQIAVVDDNQIIGVCGIWIGTKLWSGKYMELDNIVVTSKKRSNGAGKLLFEYAQKLADKECCNIMALDSYTDNFRAHRFFYNQAFIPRGFHFISILNKDKMRS